MNFRCPNESGEFSVELFEIATKSLDKAIKDSKLLVRKLAIRGYGMIGSLSGATTKNGTPLLDDQYLIKAKAKRAVDACLIGLDDTGDRSDQLAIEAVDALDRLVVVADHQLVVNILPQLLLKIRPCFEKVHIGICRSNSKNNFQENALLRAAAFSLFSGLGSSVGDCAIFKESLHNNIVSVLLHLNDSDEGVQRVN